MNLQQRHQPFNLSEIHWEMCPKKQKIYTSFKSCCTAQLYGLFLHLKQAGKACYRLSSISEQRKHHQTAGNFLENRATEQHFISAALNGPYGIRTVPYSTDFFGFCAQTVPPRNLVQGLSFPCLSQAANSLLL